MPVSYEWSAAVTDEHGDQIDVRHYTAYAEALTDQKANPRVQIELVRDVGDDIAGLQDRLWAPVVNGRLADEFNAGEGCPTGVRVPKRFHVEVARAKTSNG